VGARRLSRTALVVSTLSPPDRLRSPVKRVGQAAAMKIHVTSLLGAAVAVAALGFGPAAAHASVKYSPLDKDVLRTSIQGDRFEIIGGRIAETHGSAQVAQLGATLVKDHTKSLREAVALAKRLGIPVPSTPSTTEEWELATVSAMSGKAFDVSYTYLEVQDHKQDIEEVHTEQEGGFNRRVISLEHHDLPTLRTHLHLSKLAYWASTKE
jgi:putative membrane protein